MEEILTYYRKQGAPGDQTALVNLLKEVQAEYGALPQWAVGKIAESYTVHMPCLLRASPPIPL